MTLQAILSEIPRLTAWERLVLLETVSRSLREELGALTPTQRAEREATVDRLFGALQPDGTTPTDDDLREAYTDDLGKKYA
jgi:hypothetical protein